MQKNEGSSIKEKSRKTIRSRIISMAILIAMIPLIVSCCISTSFSIGSGQKTAYEQLETRTDSVMQQVKAYVQQGYSVMESLACGTDIRSLNPTLQREILIQTIQNNPAFILLYQQDTKGDQTARTSGELGNRADRWWFIQEMQTKKPFVSKSYYTLSTNEAVTSIVFPVFGDNNELTGILAADFSLSKLQDIIKHKLVGRNKVGTTGQETWIIIFDSSYGLSVSNFLIFKTKYLLSCLLPLTGKLLIKNKGLRRCRMLSL